MKLRSYSMAIALAIGTLNCLLNVILWLVHSIVARLMEKTYVLLSSLELSKTGATDATDAGEVHVEHWFGTLFSFADETKKKKKRKMVNLWTLGLLIALFSLFPMELLFETGIHSSKRCKSKEVESSGICASTWKGHSDVGVSSAALMTQRFKWVDGEWDAVLEGSAKQPNEMEVRKNVTLKPGRRVVLSACKVKISNCSADGCGSLTIHRTGGSFDTVVTRAAIHTGGFREYTLSDLTYDGAMGLAFLFWEGNRTAKGGSRSLISTADIEAVLSEKEVARVLLGKMEPRLLLPPPARTRLYEITCETDGLLPKDLTRAVSLYRTTQMEQPGVKRATVNSTLSRLKPLTSSDIVKSRFSLKAEDGSSACTGKIDRYTECGTVLMPRIMPFFIASIVLSIVWLVAKLVLLNLKTTVPHDASTWRKAMFVQLKQAQARTPSENHGLSIQRSKSDGDAAGRGAGENEENENPQFSYEPSNVVLGIEVAQALNETGDGLGAAETDFRWTQSVADVVSTRRF